MVLYILTKFGADWLIFVDARVLTRKLWTDGQLDGHRRTVSDHTGSLSNACLGELKSNRYPKFEVNILHKNSDMRNCQKF